jgi:hypothetical protein
MAATDFDWRKAETRAICETCDWLGERWRPVAQFRLPGAEAAAHQRDTGHTVALKMRGMTPLPKEGGS